MRFHYRTICSFIFALAIVGVARAEAQTTSAMDLTVSAAMIDYDLSGVGTTAGIAVRSNYYFSRNVSLEFGGAFAWPEQQFGRATLFMPETHLRYRWHAGRVTPYVGGGIGVARVGADFYTDWDPTLSIAGGAGVRLTDRLAITGEFRLRGHEWDFAASTTDLSAGLTWQLPGF